MTGKLVNVDEIARKREQMRQEAQAEAATRRMPAVTPTGSPAKPKRPAKGALNFQMPTIPMTGIGPAARVATSVRDVVSEDFRNQVLPKLMEKHGFTPEADAGLAHEAERGVGNRIGWALNAFHRKSDWSGGKRTNEQTDLVPAVYATMLKDLENWDPATQTRKVKNAETGEVSQAPLDFQHFLDRVTDRTVPQLKGEDLPENPTIEHDPDEVADDFLKQFTAGREPGEAKAAKAILDGLRKGVIGYDEPATPLNLIYHPDMPAEFRSVHKIGPLFNRLVDEAEQYHRENGDNPLLPPMSTRSTEGEDEDSAGGGSITAPVTQEDLERRRGESTALEDEKRKDLADLWFAAYLDKAGEEVYHARTGGEPLDRLRKKYGDEAVDERSKAIDDLAPAFNKYVKSGYDMSQVGMEDLPKLTTPAKNILPIKRAANRDELRFLKEFTAGMGPEEKQAAETIYFGRRRGINTRELAGHHELPEKFQFIHQLAPVSARLNAAAQEFSCRTGKDVWSKIKPNRSIPRSLARSYIEESEHHPGLERFVRAKLGDAGMYPELLSVFQRSMLGTNTARSLYDDPQLMKLAEREYLENTAKAGRSVGKKPTKNAEGFVLRNLKKFREWVPEYFDSIGEPQLAQKYRAEAEARHQVGVRRGMATMGQIEHQSAEELAAVKQRSNQAYAESKKSQRLSKRTIDRNLLGLGDLHQALEDEFNRKIQGRSSRYAKERADLAIRVIVGRLNHKSHEEIAEEPEVRRIARLPGFFRGVTEITPRNMKRGIENLFRLVNPIIAKVSPVLAGIWKMNNNALRNNFNPLDEGGEPTK